MSIPEKQVRAVYDDKTIRIYQAFNHAIANAALKQGTFTSPPFKIDRMTWIKPSFLWMMYRCGWAKKDKGQERVLAIDISRDGFEWALNNSLLAKSRHKYNDKKEWLALKENTPVRIQWDPERDFFFQPLDHRSIQVGLCRDAVKKYVNEWIVHIEDVTELTFNIHKQVEEDNISAATLLLPNEKPYPLPNDIKIKVGIGG